MGKEFIVKAGDVLGQFKMRILKGGEQVGQVLEANLDTLECIQTVGRVDETLGAGWNPRLGFLDEFGGIREQQASIRDMVSKYRCQVTDDGEVVREIVVDKITFHTDTIKQYNEVIELLPQRHHRMVVLDCGVAIETGEIAYPGPLPAADPRLDLLDRVLLCQQKVYVALRQALEQGIGIRRCLEESPGRIHWESLGYPKTEWERKAEGMEDIDGKSYFIITPAAGDAALARLKFPIRVSSMFGFGAGEKVANDADEYRQMVIDGLNASCLRMVMVEGAE